MTTVTVKNRDFTQGKVLKKLILFAIPLALAALVQKLFNAADVAIVGQFGGSEYQAAVGATSSTISLIVNFFIGFSVGVNVVMANAQGAKDDDWKSRVLHTGVTLSIIGGVLVLAIGLLASGPILRLIKTPDDVVDYAILYLKVYFLGVPAQLIYNFAAAILRAVGESKRPLYYLTVAGVLNVMINIITVVFLKWHVVGVALGTVLAHYLSAAWVLYDLKKGKAGVAFSFKKLRLFPKETKRILTIGLPMGLNSCLFSVSNLLIQSNVNAFGKAAVAGKAIASNLEEIVETFAGAISNGVVTFVGQNIGAKKPHRVHRIIGAGLTCTSIWLSFTGIMLVTCGEYLCMIYNTDTEVISWAMRRILVMEALYITTTFSSVYGGALRGMGYTVFTMLTNLFFSCLLRIAYLSFIYPLLPQTYEMIYTIYPISWLMSGLVQMTVYYVVGKKNGHFIKPKEENELPQAA